MKSRCDADGAMISRSLTLNLDIGNITRVSSIMICNVYCIFLLSAQMNTT